MDMYTQNVYGGRFYFKSITGGVEFDNYSSSIIPYQRINYYLSFNLNLSSKILVSLNSSLRDYKLIGTDVDHQYTNISGRIAYSITSKSKINLQTGYLSQKGKSIDLQLLTGQLEYIARMRKFYFKTGLNLYNRAYSNSSIFYFRTYIQLTRKF
jgi:hypothetical protein